jgi:predicted GIY-YIG superfamily endonuclease
VLEHRRAENPKSFTATYGAFRLVYYEEFGDVRAAIAREKRIRRDWKTSRLEAVKKSILLGCPFFWLRHSTMRIGTEVTDPV